MERMQLEAEIRTQDLVTQEASRTGLFQRFFKTLIDFEHFTVDVVVAHGNTHGVGCNGHAFDHDVRVETQDIAVFESAGFALVGVTYQVLLTGQAARHEAPLQTRWKTCTTTTAQGRSLDFSNHVFGLHAGSQYFTQSFIATTLDVLFQAPVIAVQTSQNLWLNMTIMKNHAARQVATRVRFQSLCELAQNVRCNHADSPCVFNSSSMASMRSASMRTHMC